MPKTSYLQNLPLCQTCVHSMSKTIRDLRVKYVVEQTDRLEGQNEFKFDNAGELYLLTYAYDLRPVVSKKTLCIFGILPITSLHLLLLSMRLHSSDATILLFTERSFHTKDYTGYFSQVVDLINSFEGMHHLHLVGDPISNLIALRNRLRNSNKRNGDCMCSMIHISVYDFIFPSSNLYDVNALVTAVQSNNRYIWCVCCCICCCICCITGITSQQLLQCRW